MIYTITLMNNAKIDDLTNLPTFGDRYCIGYFKSLKEAFQEVDLIKATYRYCIVEAIPEGIYAESKVRFLYEKVGNNYIPVDEPEAVMQVRNFSIG